MRAIPVLIFAITAILSAPIFASEPLPGSGCGGAGMVTHTGGPGAAPARILICDGNVWRVASEQSHDGKTLFQVGPDSGPCSTDKTGRLRYDGASGWSYCNGTSWVAFGGAGGWLYGR